ncbi:hypothetical protein ACVMGC_005947 [Bradyrhizobium barranii subsp. barranii]
MEEEAPRNRGAAVLHRYHMSQLNPPAPRGSVIETSAWGPLFRLSQLILFDVAMATMTKSSPQKALEAAKEKLQLAKAKLDAMRNAKTLDELAALWGEFVAEQHRVYLRLRKATGHGPGKGWFDRILNEQRSDALLSYLLHARDAAEHGIEKITEKRDGGIGINPKQGNSLHIKHMKISNGPHGVHIEADPETMAQIKVEFIPGKVHLVAVTDRREVYQPPATHLDQPISDLSPIVAAELAVQYLEAKLAEAEAKYVK